MISVAQRTITKDIVDQATITVGPQIFVNYYTTSSNDIECAINLPEAVYSVPNYFYTRLAKDELKTLINALQAMHDQIEDK